MSPSVLRACSLHLLCILAVPLEAQDWRLQVSRTPQRVMIGDPTTGHLLTIGIGTGGTGVFDGVALHHSPHQVPGQAYSRPFVDWTRRRVQSGDPAVGFLEWIDGAWVARPGTGGGPAGAVCVYDSTRQRIVAFRSWPEETWEFDGAGWTRVQTAHAPTVVGYSMAFDEAQGRTMLFGGYYGPAAQVPASGTWAYDGVDWAFVGYGPSGSSMVTYDRRVGAFVALFGPGGTAAGFYMFAGSWSSMPWPAIQLPTGLLSDPVSGAALVSDGVSIAEWSGSAWVSRNAIPWPPRPSLSSYPKMATDIVRRRVVWVGYQSSYTFETWEWDGFAWQQRQPANSPSPRRDFGLAYDTMRQRTVLFGGTDNQPRNDTYEWDGTDWTLRTPTHVPPVPVNSSDGVLGYDPQRGIVLYQLAAGSYQTWVWDGVDWTQFATGSQMQFTGIAWDPAAQRLVGHSHWGSGVLGELTATGWVSVPIVGCSMAPPAGELVSLPFQGILVCASPTPHRLVGNCWQPLPAAPGIATAAPYAAGPLFGGVLSAGNGTWLYSWAPSRTDIQGAGCPANTAPRLRASNQPQLGHAFALTIGTDEAPNTPMLAAIDFGNGPIGLGHGCTVHLSSAPIVTLAFANAAGAHWLDLPLPAMPSARGLVAYAQVAVLSSSTPLGLALSNGLMLTLGD